MLRVPARLQALPHTSGHQAWVQKMWLVGGSSDVHAVGGAVSSVSYSFLLVPLPFSAGPLASKPAVRPFLNPSRLPSLSPLSLAGARRGLTSCPVCEDCLALLLASEIDVLYDKLLLSFYGACIINERAVDRSGAVFFLCFIPGIYNSV